MIEAIKKRRSFRCYKPDSVSEENIIEIIKAAQFAPTGHNKRAIEFLVVKDLKTKEAIWEVVDQEYIKTAPVLIVPVATSEASLPIQDLSIASAHMFLQAAQLGLGTVWKHLTPEWAEKVKQILNIPDDCQLTNIIPVGFPDEEKGEHTEDEFSKAKIHTEKW